MISFWHFTAYKLEFPGFGPRITAGTVYVPWQQPLVKNDLEEDPEAAGAEAIDDGPDEGVAEVALAVRVRYLSMKNRDL